MVQSFFLKHHIMKNLLLRLTFVAAATLSVNAWGQVPVDRSKYPDYSDKLNPDPSLSVRRVATGAKSAQTRPDHWNNADTRYFPPVFNQQGGSCGSASRICYMFSHELNSYRDLDGKDANNYYPSHFVWLLTNGNSGKDAFVQFVGVPSAATYGGQTYSKLFGYQEETDNDFGWMTGYEKWYEAMHNRMQKPTNFAESVGSESGREAVKNWLWNHNGDTDFKAGGIVGLGVASGGTWASIPSTATNDELGVTGMYYVKKWGTSVDHALTLVGYDDRIEFDLNGNGVYGEESADEKGAWIIVNSWGDSWCNSGFIYCPYAYAGPVFSSDGIFPGGFWQPEVYKVRKNYRPLRTIKLEMDYSRRSELYLSAGVSRDLNATAPEAEQAFDHFKYAGDGANGDTNPAPEVPMLGRWADGKLHTEPMEFGYDLTDLTDNFDRNEPLKYFFKIQTKNSAKGEGHIYKASIIDYDVDSEGIETPFDTCGAEGVSIQNKGKTTLISVVVQGNGVYAPQNASISDGVFTWTAPVKSSFALTGYKVYCGDEAIATLGTSATSYNLPEGASGTYEVAALYGERESEKAAASVPVSDVQSYVLDLQKSGFTIPDVFDTKYEQATIEFWVNPNSLTNWNNAGGPGWGQFMFHANSDGAFTAGWNTDARLSISGALKKNTWSHIAIVVNKSNMYVYVNGVNKGTKSSSGYKGLGGFGDLTFSSSTSNNNYNDAKYDEIRIWKTVRKSAEIKNNYMTEFGDAALPEDLIAYFKGDFITVNGERMLRDHTAYQHHATLHNTSYEQLTSGGPNVSLPTGDLTVSINQPTETVYVGQPITLTASTSLGAQTLKWTAEDAGLNGTSVVSPTLIFNHTGEQTVSVTATDQSGQTATAELKINVETAPAPDAAFTMNKTSVPAGERVSFVTKNTTLGYSYKWNMPGAVTEEATSINAAAVYEQAGSYEVALTVTDATGQSATSKQTVTVTDVAPKPDFDVNPAVVMKGEQVTLTDKTKYSPEKWAWRLLSSTYAYEGWEQNNTFAPEQPGVYDVTLKASNKVGENSTTLSRALIVCNADSKNGLNINYDAAKVTATNVPFAEGQKTFTIDWWMNPAQLASQGNAIGDESATLLITTTSSGEMQVSASGKAVKSQAGFVKANEWHNYAVSLRSGSVRFFRDGEQMETVTLGVSSLKALSKFVIGNENMPFNGQIDEFRVWNTALGEENLQQYINQPLDGELLTTAENTDGLQLYYQFNQSGGDVQDASSKANTGVRSGFGPDGDAWGLSKGVFCLNFTSEAEDVSGDYLKNYKAPFTNTGKTVNSGNSSRFLGLKSWEQENNVVNGSVTTGAHVDVSKERALTVTTGWDGFESSLTDHKIFQTVTLPAGAYVFEAYFGSYEGEASGSYLAVALGEGLPNTADINTAVAYTAMEPKSTEVTSNSVYFVLTEEAKVSLGIVANLSGNQLMSFTKFSLTKLGCTDLSTRQNGISDTLHATSEPSNIYDLSGRRVATPAKGGVYIVNGKKLIIK